MVTIGMYNYHLQGKATPLLAYKSEEFGAFTETISSNGLESLVPYFLQRVGPSSKLRQIAVSPKPFQEGENYSPATEEQRTHFNKLLAEKNIRLVWIN